MTYILRQIRILRALMKNSLTKVKWKKAYQKYSVLKIKPSSSDEDLDYNAPSLDKEFANTVRMDD